MTAEVSRYTEMSYKLRPRAPKRETVFYLATQTFCVYVNYL